MNMNPDMLIQTVQKGFRVSLGATATLLESLQDAQKRTETMNKLSANPTQLIDEWEAKGEVTEQEARNFVDTLISQSGMNPNGDRTTFYRDPAYRDPTSPTTTVNTTATAPAAEVTPDVQQDIQDLTAQIAALRAELEKLRETGS